MSGRVGDISPKQAETLRKFKDNLEDVLRPHHDDHFLLRWLRARKFDIKKSEKMLRDSLLWRQQTGADTVLETWQPPDVLKKYYPGGLHGCDKDGCPVWIEPSGYADVRGLMHSAKKSDILKMKVYHTEMIYRVFQEQTQKQGKIIDNLVIIADFEKYGLKHLWKPAIDLYTEILAVFEANYPETLKRTYVVNAPRIFPIMYNLGKPFLSEDTRGKISIYGSNWKERLLKEIDADQLPVHWGGTATGPDGSEFGNINMGGDVPKEAYIQRDECVNMDSFLKATVNRGSSLELSYTVQHPGSLLTWQFSTMGKDIRFAVYRKTSAETQKLSDMELIVAPQRANCHMVPEDGSLTCTQTGSYVVVFDNTYSWVYSKKLLYQVQVLPPDDLQSLQKSPSFAVPYDASAQTAAKHLL